MKETTEKWAKLENCAPELLSKNISVSHVHYVYEWRENIKIIVCMMNSEQFFATKKLFG